ncbi:transposase [Robbsia sp. Bb-Pol-6]|uniref:Transposase n=1 Tax=Robbsia betulipollinis TaxID=2981849 RepID=A0ABT3ZTL7_9BURK|nr:transposase [Robbsia betulipollinis]MCY0389797.1 transposase [Robbsia betulipollinis]
MEAKRTYSVEFKEQAISKVLQRGSRTLEAVADELNVNVWTSRNWMKSVVPANRSVRPEQGKCPDD